MHEEFPVPCSRSPPLRSPPHQTVARSQILVRAIYHLDISAYGNDRPRPAPPPPTRPPGPPVPKFRCFDFLAFWRFDVSTYRRFDVRPSPPPIPVFDFRLSTFDFRLSTVLRPHSGPPGSQNPARTLGAPSIPHFMRASLRAFVPRHLPAILRRPLFLIRPMPTHRIRNQNTALDISPRSIRRQRQPFPIPAPHFGFRFSTFDFPSSLRAFVPTSLPPER